MKRLIYKYEIPFNGGEPYELKSRLVQPLYFDFDPGNIACVWAITEVTEEGEPRIPLCSDFFQLVMTGGEEPKGMLYLGTAVRRNDGIVLHCYYRLTE